MSGNRRKTQSSKPAESVEQPAVAQVVPLPKPGEAGQAKPEAKIRPKSEKIGDILRAARIERNDDLYQIAEYLCIKPAFLVALENSRYDEFPADAYVIGFLRSYANFLGVDGKDAVDRYRYEMAGRRKKPVLSMPIPITEGRAPSALIMVGATVVLLLIYALWYGISSANRTAVNVPPPLPSPQQISETPPQAPDSAPAGANAPVAAVPATAEPVPPVLEAAPVSASVAAAIPPAAPGIVVSAAAPAAKTDMGMLGKDAAKEAAPKDEVKDSKSKDATAVAAAPASAPPTATPDTIQVTKDGKKQIYGDPDKAAHIIIRATQTSWVMVNDASGKTIFDHVLKAGDIFKVPNQPGLTLTTGNGNGLVIALDGVEMPKVATGSPHVVKDIPLDAEHLNTEPSAQ